MASVAGRGGQVRLSGAAQQAARGRYTTTVEGNTDYKRGLELAGTVADGTTADGSTSTGTAAVDEALTRGPALIGSYALTDAATIATDGAFGNFFTVTLGGNRTLGAPTNQVAGERYVWKITQDGTGSRTLAFASAFKWASGTAPTVTSTAGAVSIISATSDGTNLYGTSILAAA